MHLSEEDLILHYYGETEKDGSVDQHLRSCAQCQTELARLQEVLRLVDEQPLPELSPAFERVMWARIEPQLSARRRWLVRRSFSEGGWMMQWLDRRPTWVVASGAAVLLIAAFVAGRVSTPAPPTPSAEVEAAINDRVLLVAVVDHLDRSQMVLVELLNGEDLTTLDINAEQTRARDLVAANRIYRQTAAQTGDEAVGDVLDQLERVLLEIANAEKVTSEDLATLRHLITTRGLLFKMRVVQSEIREKARSRQFVIG